jgi:2-polyprenyl-6-methoxyphenol hydroxylase-like FAD-dependent oxidoreductase
MTTPKLPVVIAGAGPCRLVAAITLQKEGVQFVIVERAARKRLCSNVGSGFDLAPMVIDILKN